MWWSKKPKTNNVYALLDKELERLHGEMNSNEWTGDALTDIFRRIKAIEDAVLEALKSQPSHDEQIKDLQETVTDMILTGTESK